MIHGVAVVPWGDTLQSTRENVTPVQSRTWTSCTLSARGWPDEAIFNSILWANQRLALIFSIPTHAPTHTHGCEPVAIYNSWHDPIAPLREELREFKPWPNYAPIHLAPSALCSQKVERVAVSHTHTHAHSAFRTDGLFQNVSAQTL